MSSELFDLAKSFSKYAKRENRKSIEKKLQDAKKLYDIKRQSLTEKKRHNEILNTEIDRLSADMNAARDYMRTAYDTLSNLDQLSDVNYIRWNDKKEDIGYIKQNRIYRLKNNEDGSVDLEPYNKKNKLSKDSEGTLEEQDSIEESCDPNDDLMDADSLLDSILQG